MHQHLTNSKNSVILLTPFRWLMSRKYLECTTMPTLHFRLVSLSLCLTVIDSLCRYFAVNLSPCGILLLVCSLASNSSLVFFGCLTVSMLSFSRSVWWASGALTTFKVEFQSNRMKCIFQLDLIKLNLNKFFDFSCFDVKDYFMLLSCVCVFLIVDLTHKHIHKLIIIVIIIITDICKAQMLHKATNTLKQLNRLKIEKVFCLFLNKFSGRSGSDCSTLESHRNTSWLEAARSSY